MLRQSRVMGAAIGLLAAAATPALAQNLLNDPSFENPCLFNPFEGWDKIGLNAFLVDDGNERTAPRGASSIPSYFSPDANDPTGTNQTGFEQRVAAPAAGTVLNGSAWIRSGATQFGTNVRQFVQIQFLDSSGAVMGCACETDGDDAQVDVFDLLGFLDLWFAADAGADIDGTPGVDVFDLLAFLDCWFPASAGATCDPTAQSSVLDKTNTPTMPGGALGYVQQTVSATVPDGAATVLFRIVLEQERDFDPPSVPADNPDMIMPGQCVPSDVLTPADGLAGLAYQDGDCGCDPDGCGFVYDPVNGVYRDGQQYMDDAFLATADAPGVNLLINSSFDVVCTGPFFEWTEFGGFNTPATDFARTGSYSARILGPFWFQGNDGGFFQDAPATAGAQYQGRIYYMTPAGAEVSDGISARVRLEFFDGFGTNLSAMEPGWPDSFQSVDLATTTTPNEWTLGETPVIVAPAGSTIVRFVYAHLLPNFNGGEMRIDDAELVEVAP